MLSARRLVAPLAAVVVTACTTTPPPPEQVPSIADFADFRSWTRTPVSSSDIFPHAIYSNPIADHGPPYALGTAFVRAEEAGDPQSWLLHGMFLRGGTYNEGLASGWEFFGLFIDQHGDVKLIWADEHPPLGAGYIEPDVGLTDVGPLGLPEGDCNICHRDPSPVIPYR